MEELTNRELEVLKLLSKGLNNKEIQQKMFIGLATVKTYLHTIYSKLGISREGMASSELRLKAALIYLKYMGKLKDD